MTLKVLNILLPVDLLKNLVLIALLLYLILVTLFHNQPKLKPIQLLIKLIPVQLKNYLHKPHQVYY